MVDTKELCCGSCLTISNLPSGVSSEFCYITCVLTKGF